MARPCLFNNPKFKSLVFLLKEPKPHVLGYLELLWAAANESGDPVIGDSLAVEATAEYPGRPGDLVNALEQCRLIDKLANQDRYQIHDFWDHAPDYVAKRRFRERERKAKGQTLSEVRSAAGKRGAQARHSKDTANGDHLSETPSNCQPFASQDMANGMTPAPAPSLNTGPLTEAPRNDSPPNEDLTYDNANDPIEEHEASYDKLLFPEKFAEVVELYPHKAPAKRSRQSWRKRVKRLEDAEEIRIGIVAWMDTNQWRNGYGIPTLANFIEEQWCKNLPVPVGYVPPKTEADWIADTLAKRKEVEDLYEDA